MKIIEQCVQLLPGMDQSEILSNFGSILNVPYNKDSYDLAKTRDLLRACIKRGHHSVLEHVSATLKCRTNIATYKDFTRHRHCAFTIESTSFTQYNELEVILADQDPLTIDTLSMVENTYKYLVVNKGVKIARDVLPQSRAAIMVMTTNFREWRYIIGLRGDPNDNPLTNQLRDMMWKTLNYRYPFFFPFVASTDEPMLIRNEWGNKDYASLVYESQD